NKMDEALEHEEPRTDLLIIDREAEEGIPVSVEEEDYIDLEKTQLEARADAEKTKHGIGQKENTPLQVVDKETGNQRDAQFRDIVILQRSMTWAPTIEDELKIQGIPVYAEV